MSDNIDDLFVSLNVDLAGLDSGLNEAVNKVKTASNAFDEMFAKNATAIDPVDEAVKKLTSSTENLGAAARNSEQGWMSLGQNIQQTGSAAREAATAGDELLGQFAKFASVVAIFELTARAIGQVKDVLVSAAESGLEMAGNIEKATVSMTALTGSADRASTTISQVMQMAISDGLSFQPLMEGAQRMTSLGFSATQTRAGLQAAADASAAVGVSIGQVISTIDRLSQSGMVSGRQMQVVGLNLQDLAKAAKATVADLQGPGNIFKAMDPGDRLDLMIKAIETKFKGQADAAAGTFKNMLQSMRTSVESELQPIGDSLIAIFKPLLASIKTEGIPAFNELIQAIKRVSTDGGPALLSYFKELITFGSNAATAISGVTHAFADLADTIRKDLGASQKDLEEFQQRVDKLTVIAQTGGLALLAEGVSKIASAFNGLNTDVRTFTPGLEAAVVRSQRFSQATADMKEALDKTTSALLETRNEMDRRNKALQVAKDALDTMIEAEQKGLAVHGQVVEAEKEYQKALAAVTGELTKHKDVQELSAAAAERLATALNKQIDKLNDMKARVGEAAIGSGQLAKQQDLVNEATVKATAALEKISNSHTDNAVKAKQNAAAHDDLVKALGRLMGPVQQADFGIEIIAGSHRNAAAEAALHAQKVTTLSNTWSTSAGVIAGAADAMANGITASFGKIQTSGIAIKGTIAGLDADFGKAMEDILTGAEGAVQGPKDLGDAIDQLIDTTNSFTAGALPKVINGMPPLVDALDRGTASMRDFGASSQSTAAALAEVGAAAASAATEVQTLGQELDQAMSAKLGSFNVSLKPGDVIKGSLPNMAVGLGGQNYESVMGTPQEIADRFAADAQALAASRQALQKIIDDARGLGKASSTSSVWVEKLGTAAATAASALAAAPTPDQQLTDLLTLLSANPDLKAAFQNLNNELAIARNLYDSGIISQSAYQQAIDAATHAQQALTADSGTASTAVATLAAASTNAAASIALAGKSLDQVAQVAVAVAAATVSGVKSLVSGPALGSLATVPDIPGSRGMLGAIGALSVSDSGGYSKVQSTPGGWQKNEFTFNATPSVAELGHQFMDFLRGQGITL